MSSANKIVRIHAPYVSENEIEKINNYLRSQAEPDYIDEILNFVDEKEMSENSKIKAIKMNYTTMLLKLSNQKEKLQRLFTKKIADRIQSSCKNY